MLEPFGTHAPTTLQAALISLCAESPLSPVLRRGAFRKRIARLVTALREGPIDLERDGLRYRLNPADNAAEVGVLLDPAYQDKSLAFVCGNLAAGGVFVDLGANIGQFTLHGAKTVGPTGRVIAVEPTSSPLARLTANVTLSGFDDRVTIVPVACGDAEGTVRFTIDEIDTALSKADDGGSAELPMQTLHTIARQAGLDRIDVLKIDIEGMEDRALSAFFLHAPATLWPRAICLEDEQADFWLDDIRPVLEGLGYRTLAERTKGNAFLLRETA